MIWLKLKKSLKGKKFLDPIGGAVTFLCQSQLSSGKGGRTDCMIVCCLKKRQLASGVLFAWLLDSIAVLEQLHDFFSFACGVLRQAQYKPYTAIGVTAALPILNPPGRCVIANAICLLPVAYFDMLSTIFYTANGEKPANVLRSLGHVEIALAIAPSLVGLVLHAASPRRRVRPRRQV